MIFLSYSSRNNELAAEVKGELEKAYYACFLAHDDVTVSGDWHEEIWKALRACDAFVGLVTKEFNASAFCQQEVGAAFAFNKPRILVRLGVPDPPGFASRFQGATRGKLVQALDTLDMFQSLRIESWITAVASVQNYSESNDVHARFTDTGRDTLQALDIFVQRKIKDALEAVAQKPSLARPLKEQLTGYLSCCSTACLDDMTRRILHPPLEEQEGSVTTLYSDRTIKLARDIMHFVTKVAHTPEGLFASSMSEQVVKTE